MRDAFIQSLEKPSIEKIIVIHITNKKIVLLVSASPYYP